MNNDYFGVEYEDVRQWNELLNHAYFDKVVKKITNDMVICDRNIEKLCSVGSLDSSIKLTIETATRERLKDILRYFEFMREKKLLLDKEIAKQKAINASV